jgi:hypothetical protein
MTKLGWLIILCSFALISCSKSEDPKTAQSAPVVQQPLPINPVCNTRLYTNSGGMGFTPYPRSMDVVIPGFDKSKGDTADFSFKKWDATEWSTFRPGYYSDVTLTVVGSTVTIINTNHYQIDWAISATIKECQ